MASTRSPWLGYSPDAAPDRSLGTGTSNSDRIDAVYFSCAAYAVTGTARTMNLFGAGPWI